MVTQIKGKHEADVNLLIDEVKVLKQSVFHMVKKIKSLKDELKSCTNKVNSDKVTEEPVEIKTLQTYDNVSPTDEDGCKNCDLCNYKYKKEKTMSRHIKNKHGKFQACNVCGKGFASIASLYSHTERERDNDSNEIYSDQDMSTQETSFVFSESILDEFLDNKE